MDFKNLVIITIQDREKAEKEIAKLEADEINALIQESIQKYPQENEIRSILKKVLKLKIKTWTTKKLGMYVYNEYTIEYLMEILSRNDCPIKYIIGVYNYTKKHYHNERTTVNLGFAEYLKRYSYAEIKEEYDKNIKIKSFCHQLNLHLIKGMVKKNQDILPDVQTIFNQQYEKNYLPGMRLLAPFLK